MDKNKKSPEAKPRANSDLLQNCTSTSCDCKDTTFLFKSHPTRRRVFELLLTGEKYSIVQLSIILKNPDPRSIIRYIRQSGILVSDAWIKTDFSRYKVYFIAKI